MIASELTDLPDLDVPPTACGMRLPVLRETRMPAVLLALGPARTIADAAPQVTAAILRAVDLWILRAS